MHDTYICGVMNSCGGVITYREGMHMRDRIFYLRLFNKKHVKSHESILYAGSLEDAEKIYAENKPMLPRHVYHEISDYALDNARIPKDGSQDIRIT